MSAARYQCSCNGCGEYVDAATALDYCCDYCFAFCVDDQWLYEPGETVDGARMARSLVGIARWKTHTIRAWILDRGLDPIEWGRRIFAGEMPPTVMQLFDGDDPDATYDRTMFRLRSEDQEDSI